MARTIQDDDLRVWEVYPSSGAEGLHDDACIVFNCLTNRLIRPRYVEVDGADGAEAERLVVQAPDLALKEMLLSSKPVD